MRIKLAWAFLSCAAYALVRCGGDNGVNLDGGLDVTMNDVTPGSDASNDVMQNDTGNPNDTGTGTDTGGSDASDGGTAMDSGGSNIGSWTCGNATVTDCSQCIGHTQPCVYCANMDASALAGICVQQGTGCGNGTPTGYNLCKCNTDAGVCPEAYQVCLFAGTAYSVCDTCGAVNQTNNLTCKSGGKCDAFDGGCL
jgi:hypothetical protein